MDGQGQAGGGRSGPGSTPGGRRAQDGQELLVEGRAASTGGRAGAGSRNASPAPVATNQAEAEYLKTLMLNGNEALRGEAAAQEGKELLSRRCPGIVIPGM